MGRLRWPLVSGLILAAAWWTSAQEGAPSGTAEPTPAPTRAALPPTVEEALLRPSRIAFARPTPLSEVVVFLRELLRAPVVLDRAAMARLDVTEEDTVQLELDGVRLKTALPLLLDQVGMTYRVEPEDNLLVLTDREGANDRIDRILLEIERLHDDVHDLQDTVDLIGQNLVPVEIIPEDGAMPVEPDAPAPAEAGSPAGSRHGRAG